MADVKWIKIATEVFDNRKIKQIEKMPAGDSIIVIWFKLLCLAGNINSGGMVYFTPEMPYTEEMLATEFNIPMEKLQTLKLALLTFQKFNMIEIIDNVFYISSWDKYQNIEGLEKIREQNRIRKQKERERKSIECHVTCHGDVTQSHATDIDIESDKDIDIDIKDSRAKSKRFVPPTLEDVKIYCKERNNKVDAERFINHYTANGWVQGKGKPIKDWKACIKTWESNDKQTQLSNTQPKPAINKQLLYPQREYSPQDYVDLERKLLSKGL